MNVLHILTSAQGGAAHSTFDLIDDLKKRGVNSSLVCLNNADKNLCEEIINRVEGRVLFIPLHWTNKRIRAKYWKRPLIEILSLWQTWAGYRYQSRISQMIRENEIDLIHSSTILIHEGAIASKKNNIPHVWHVRELVGEGTYFQFRNYRNWASFISAHANLLVANSQTTYGHLLTFFNADKIKCVPNGIRLEQFRYKVHKDGKHPMVVGMVGNVSSRLKNHEMFIRAAIQVEAKDVEFRIYGTLPAENDPYYSSLREMVMQCSNSTRIKFIPYRANPSDIMEEIDILVHPTEQESFGRIFIEAMASGIPVIGIKGSGAGEIILDGVNGYLCEGNDAKVMAERIRVLLSSAEIRNEMGRNGRIQVEEKYTIDRVTDDMISIYNQILSIKKNGT